MPDQDLFAPEDMQAAERGSSRKMAQKIERALGTDRQEVEKLADHFNKIARNAADGIIEDVMEYVRVALVKQAIAAFGEEEAEQMAAQAGYTDGIEGLVEESDAFYAYVQEIASSGLQGIQDAWPAAFLN